MKSDLKITANSKSVFSESIKTIRTNLAFSVMNKGKLKTILFTSPESGDGKSFITANLAVAYAQEGKSVLLIDCDLRKGRQHEIFKVTNSVSRGYSTLILNYKEDINLDKYIIETGTKRVDLITTGPTPPNPIELLNSIHNKKLIEKLKKMYDIIIFDCPPAIGLSDALVMTQYSDANVVVVSNKKTKIELLDRVKKAFAQANAPITGVVVNRASVKDNSYYGYYCNDYYGKSN